MSKSIINIIDDAGLAPAAEPAIDGRPFSIKFRYLSPCKAIPDNEQNGADNLSVVNASGIDSGWKKPADFIKLSLRDKGCFHFLILMGGLKVVWGNTLFLLIFYKSNAD